MTDKKYCKCPYCGSECEVDTSIVLASIPPQYEGFCKNCNKVIYTLCSNTYGKASMNQENNITDYRNDIHRIADALEKIAKSLDGEKKQQQLKTIDNVRCPHCGSYKISYLLTNPNEPDKCKCNDCGATWEEKYNTSITTSVAPNACEGCPIYKEIKKGKTVINDACSFCSKNPFKVTCEATNNDR